MQQHTNKLGIIVSDRKQHVMNDLFGFTCIYMYTVIDCSLFTVHCPATEIHFEAKPTQCMKIYKKTLYKSEL